VADIVHRLEHHYGVHPAVIRALREATSRAAMKVVDSVLADKRTPFAYYVVRRFDSGEWWR
jgi:hypothetical protein